MAKPLPPGTPAPKAGQYEITSTKTEVTSTKGNPLPLGPNRSVYILVDPTKHRKGSHPRFPTLARLPAESARRVIRSPRPAHLMSD